MQWFHWIRDTNVLLNAQNPRGKSSRKSVLCPGEFIGNQMDVRANRGPTCGHHSVTGQIDHVSLPKQIETNRIGKACAAEAYTCTL